MSAFIINGCITFGGWIHKLYGIDDGLRERLICLTRTVAEKIENKRITSSVHCFIRRTGSVVSRVWLPYPIYDNTVQRCAILCKINIATTLQGGQQSEHGWPGHLYAGERQIVCVLFSSISRKVDRTLFTPPSCPILKPNAIVSPLGYVLRACIMVFAARPDDDAILFAKSGNRGRQPPWFSQ